MSDKYRKMSYYDDGPEDYIGEFSEDEMIKIGRSISAVHMCRADAGGKFPSRGSIKCPACCGKMNYTVSAYNGHMCGQCETEGCLSFGQ